MAKPSSPGAADPEKKPVDGQHIFPDDDLHILAVQWKMLNTAKRHNEAMEVLEQIVIRSTPMFERLAQHEKFHRTVDLPILVSAAQEKVVKWLLRWEPKKGRLFSWFSTSFAASTYVLLADGSARRIDDLVNNRASVSVLSWNRTTNQFEPKPIVNWIKRPADPQGWSRLTVRMPLGHQTGNWRDDVKKKFVLTNEHELYTDRGIVRVSGLKASDCLYAARPVITPDGMAVLLGKYLGDGSITSAGHFVMAHGAKQEAYVRHLATQFGNRAVWKGTVRLKYKGTIRAYTTYRMRILMKRIWPNFPLKKSKKVTDWVLDNLNPVALAYWYMDDGWLAKAANGRQFPGFCCESFPIKDCKRIQAVMLHEWGLGTWLKREPFKDGYGMRICVRDESVPRFFEYVAPYLLPIFDYKIPNAFAGIPKKSIECLRHEAVPCREWSVAPVLRAKPELAFKYDITVADNHNVIIMQNGKIQNGVMGGLCVCQCAKHAFLSELVRVNQFRKRYHTTSDNLEKFIGTEDHGIEKADLARELRTKLHGLTCRWGDPQEIGTLHYLIECIIDDDERDKHAAIRASAYAWGISPDMAKFFYAWALTSLRTAFAEKVRVPMTEQDLWLLKESYSHFPDLLDFISWEQMKEMMLRYGGMRLKVPTLASVARLKEASLIWQEIDQGDKDPDSIAEVAARHKKTPRSAAEIYEEMSRINDPGRAGEHFIYDHEDNH